MKFWTLLISIWLPSITIFKQQYGVEGDGILIFIFCIMSLFMTAMLLRHKEILTNKSSAIGSLAWLSVVAATSWHLGAGLISVFMAAAVTMRSFLEDLLEERRKADKE